MTGILVKNLINRLRLVSMVQKTIGINAMVFEALALATKSGCVPTELFLGPCEMVALDRQISNGLKTLEVDEYDGFQTVEGRRFMGMTVSRQLADGVAIR